MAPPAKRTIKPPPPGQPDPNKPRLDASKLEQPRPPDPNKPRAGGPN